MTTETDADVLHRVVADRKVNLASLIPENAIDPEIKIKALKEDGWIKGEQIGYGTYGEVYKYTTPNAGMTFAAGKHVKFNLWNKNDKQKEEIKARVTIFLEELNLMNKISHKCPERLVQFVGCYVNSKKLIIFAELMPNGSIRDHIISEPLKEATALKYIFQAAQGLHFLHHYQECRVVHRDIKCDNLLLTQQNDVKLADFGLAFNNLAVDGESYTMSQSAPSGCAGTHIYAAPEVLTGTKYGRRADIWSLGCTLVEMLTTLPPHADFWHKHKERAQFLFLEQARSDAPNQLQYVGRQLVPDASTDVQKLLDCLFIRNKQHRPRSEDVLGIFEGNPSAPASFHIDAAKLDSLQRRIREEEKYYNAYKTMS